MGRLLRLRDVEAELGVSRWTLYEWIRQGRLPALRLASGQLRVRVEDLEEFKEQMERKSSHV